MRRHTVQSPGTHKLMQVHIYKRNFFSEQNFKNTLLTRVLQKNSNNKILPINIFFLKEISFSLKYIHTRIQKTDSITCKAVFFENSQIGFYFPQYFSMSQNITQNKSIFYYFKKDAERGKTEENISTDSNVLMFGPFYVPCIMGTNCKVQQGQRVQSFEIHLSGRPYVDDPDQHSNQKGRDIEHQVEISETEKFHEFSKAASDDVYYVQQQQQQRGLGSEQTNDHSDLGYLVITIFLCLS